MNDQLFGLLPIGNLRMGDDEQTAKEQQRQHQGQKQHLSPANAKDEQLTRAGGQPGRGLITMDDEF